MAEDPQNLTPFVTPAPEGLTPQPVAPEAPVPEGLTKPAEVSSLLPTQPPFKAPDVADLQPTGSLTDKTADTLILDDPNAPEDEEPASDASSMTILQAGTCLRRGQRVARNGWRTWAAHLEHDGETVIGVGHDGRREPYTPTLEDHTATDWRVVG